MIDPFSSFFQIEAEKGGEPPVEKINGENQKYYHAYDIIIIQTSAFEIKNRSEYDEVSDSGQACRGAVIRFPSRMHSFSLSARTSPAMFIPRNFFW